MESYNEDYDNCTNAMEQTMNETDKAEEPVGLGV